MGAVHVLVSEPQVSENLGAFVHNKMYGSICLMNCLKTGTLAEIRSLSNIADSQGKQVNPNRTQGC